MWEFYFSRQRLLLLSKVPRKYKKGVYYLLTAEDKWNKNKDKYLMKNRWASHLKHSLNLFVDNLSSWRCISTV